MKKKILWSSSTSHESHRLCKKVPPRPPWSTPFRKQCSTPNLTAPRQFSAASHLSAPRARLNFAFENIGLNSCRQFYENKGLAFNDFVVLAPLPSPIKAKKEGKHRVILVVVSVFSPIIVVILAVVLIGCLLGNRNEVEDVGNAGQGAEILGAANPNGVETVVHVDDNVGYDGLGGQITFQKICQITDNFDVSRFMNHGSTWFCWFPILKLKWNFTIKYLMQGWFRS
ncbi:hypothetical protein M0R45_036646 [Rubus argutus]|uniref:Uncharacterized protein n=1 Tax=Rubus argutus TaxID=59490 RepID=A0AAW1W258_RUBAR